MKKALAIKHLEFENLGSWEEAIAQHYDIEYIDAPRDDLTRYKNDSADLVIILGGPIGVHQEQEYPFLKAELTLLEARLKHDLPTLGICLGAQLIARALGSKVYPNHTKEIGWYPLTLTEKGKKSHVQHLSSVHTSMFHWHGDTFDLPKNAHLLASTSNCQNQIFSWGKNVLAFQCHPEVMAHQLEYWWIGHATELAHHKLSVEYLRKQSTELSPKLERQSLKSLQEWLNELNPAEVKEKKRLKKIK